MTETGRGTTGGTGAWSKSRRHWCVRLKNCASGSQTPTICASARSTVTSIQEMSLCAMGALLASSIGSTRAGTGLLFELAGMVWDLSWDGTSTTIDRALRDDLVQKYVDSGDPGEAAAVVPMMRLESLVSALISLTRAAKGLPWNREFTRLLIATLDELA